MDIAARLSAYPQYPLYDAARKMYTIVAVQAFKRIFRMCDRDQDGLLSDSELNCFQMRLKFKKMFLRIFTNDYFYSYSCNYPPFKPDEFIEVKKKLGRFFPEKSNGVLRDKITFEGFFALICELLKDLDSGVAWNTLTHYNYDEEVTLMVNE